MTVVSRAVSTSHPEAASALKALSSLVGFDESSITYAPKKTAGDNDPFSVEMNVTAHNSFSGTDMSYTAHGLLGCARAICKAVPDVGLWGQLSQGDPGSALESLIESWIETAASTLVYPAYVASDSKGELNCFPHVRNQAMKPPIIIAKLCKMIFFLFSFVDSESGTFSGGN